MPTGGTDVKVLFLMLLDELNIFSTLQWFSLGFNKFSTENAGLHCGS